MAHPAGVGLDHARQGIPVVLLGCAGHVGVERLRPRRRRCVSRAVGRHRVTEVVRDVAAAQHEDAFVAKRRERTPDGEMPLRRHARIDAELDDRAVGRREQVDQHRPGAMVDAPVGPQRRALLADQLDHAPGERDVARRRVLHFVERARKAAEVVDRLRTFVAGQIRARHEPVRRDGEDRPSDAAAAPASARNPRLQALSSIAFMGEP